MTGGASGVPPSTKFTVCAIEACEAEADVRVETFQTGAAILARAAHAFNGFLAKWK